MKKKCEGKYKKALESIETLAKNYQAFVNAKAMGQGLV